MNKEEPNNKTIKYAFAIMKATDLYILENQLGEDNCHFNIFHKVIKHLNMNEEGTGAIQYDNDEKRFYFIYDIDYACSIPIEDVFLTETEAKEALNKATERSA